MHREKILRAHDNVECRFEKQQDMIPIYKHDSINFLKSIFRSFKIQYAKRLTLSIALTYNIFLKANVI